MQNVNTNLLLSRVTNFLKTKAVARLGFLLTICMWLAAFYFTLNPDQIMQYGYFGIFVFNLAGPGTLMIPALILAGMNPWLVAGFTALGMTMNDSISYAMGRFSAVVFSKSQRVERVITWVGKYDQLAILCLAVVPLPLDFVAMVVGNAKYPYRKFVIASFLGKCLRGGLMGVLTIWFGPNILLLIDQLKSYLAG